MISKVPYRSIRPGSDPLAPPLPLGRLFRAVTAHCGCSLLCTGGPAWPLCRVSVWVLCSGGQILSPA